MVKADNAILIEHIETLIERVDRLEKELSDFKWEMIRYTLEKARMLINERP